jgi:5-methylcytosine-specific restriction endonuclease McrA
VHIKTGNVYCSLKCTGLGQRKSKVCKVCKKEYSGNKRTCSRSCANKARSGITYNRENKFNKAHCGSRLKEKVAQKRGGICERCGHDNYAILQVHHKKERHRGGTDHLENLELLCPNCHAAHHFGISLWTKKKDAKVQGTKK